MVVLALLLIFLSLGLFVPEVTYTTAVTVDKDLNTTFTKFADRTTVKEWIPEVKTLEVITATPEIVGSQYRMVVDNNGQTTEMTETTEAFMMNENITLSFDAGMLQKRDTYTFAKDGSGTTITGKHIARGDSYYARCVFALAGKAFQKIDQGYMDRFGEWMDGEQ
jgi:hypothetical protein